MQSWRDHAEEVVYCVQDVGTLRGFKVKNDKVNFMLRKKFVFHSDSWNILWKGKKLRDFNIINRHELHNATITYFQLFPYFLKILFLIFMWRITALQYCISLRHTSTWIGPRYTRVPSHLPHQPTPLQVTTEHWVWAPCATQRVPTIYFTYGSVSMLLFQFIPPSPSPTVSTVCFLCLCLHCSPANRFISTIFLHIYMH